MRAVYPLSNEMDMFTSRNLGFAQVVIGGVVTFGQQLRSSVDFDPRTWDMSDKACDGYWLSQLPATL
jgi:hypothetical protein